MPRGRKPKDPNATPVQRETVWNLAVQLRRILQNEKVPNVTDVKIATEPFTTNKTLYVKLANDRGLRVPDLTTFAMLVLRVQGYTVTPPNAVVEENQPAE